MNSFKKILPPQPHYLSGYTGHVPGYKFHSGQSYGRLTHNLFLDQTIKRSDKPVLTDLTQVHSDWLSQEEKKALENRCSSRKCKYGVYMASSYKGYVPQNKFLCGNNFNVQTTKALNVFEKMRRECLCPECREMRGIDQNTHDKQTEDVNEYAHPFQKIVGGEELFKEKYKQHPAMAPSTKAYFLDNEDPQKKFIVGYKGHVPNLTNVNGIPYSSGTNEALKLFTTRYKKLKMNSSKAINMETVNIRSEPKHRSQKLPYEDGIIKNYGGHIPGDKFNVGQTFSEGSKHVKSILRQQRAAINKTFACKL